MAPQPAMDTASKKTSSLGPILARNVSGDMIAGYSIMIVLIYPSAGIDIICHIELIWLPNGLKLRHQNGTWQFIICETLSVILFNKVKNLGVNFTLTNN